MKQNIDFEWGIKQIRTEVNQKPTVNSLRNRLLLEGQQWDTKTVRDYLDAREAGQIDGVLAAWAEQAQGAPKGCTPFNRYSYNAFASQAAYWAIHAKTQAERDEATRLRQVAIEKSNAMREEKAS